MPSTDPAATLTFFDAGLFIAALLRGDPRHTEARPIVEAARAGAIVAGTSSGVLCEVYAALTWEKSQPRHDPAEAADAVRLLVEPPSAIAVLRSDVTSLQTAMQLAARHKLSARRVHDAHHAAVALAAGVELVYTYDVGDWSAFEGDGLRIVGPGSALNRLKR